MSSLVDDMRGFRNRFQRGKHKMTKEIATAVKNHTDKNFDYQGFLGYGLTRWRRKKRPDGRKVLHGKSPRHLRDSTKVLRSSWPNIVVKNDKDYADFHQNGTARMPRRQFMSKGYGLPVSQGGSPTLDKKVDRIVDKHVMRHIHG